MTRLEKVMAGIIIMGLLGFFTLHSVNAGSYGRPIVPVDTNPHDYSQFCYSTVNGTICNTTTPYGTYSTHYN